MQALNDDVPGLGNGLDPTPIIARLTRLRVSSGCPIQS